MEFLFSLVLICVLVFSIYKIVDVFLKMGAALTAANIHLDAIKKDGSNNSERIVALLEEQNTLLSKLLVQSGK